MGERDDKVPGEEVVDGIVDAPTMRRGSSRPAHGGWLYPIDQACKNGRPPLRGSPVGHRLEYMQNRRFAFACRARLMYR
jgi:hypothetical protein